MRLGDCITCDIEVPDDCRERMVPPLTLQLLAENVIKHNSISATHPMRIAIWVDDNFLVVK